MKMNNISMKTMGEFIVENVLHFLQRQPPLKSLLKMKQKDIYYRLDYPLTPRIKKEPQNY